MAQYAIYEGNLEALNKNLEKIRKKCEKYSCEFHYEEVGEEFRDVKDENGAVVTARFVLVEVSGRVVCEEGWSVVGVIDHMDNMNVIHVIDQINHTNVPERFYHSDVTCDHCNTKRRRKSTVIIYHPDHGYKQVGKTCLKDYTGGLDAEVAAYMEQYIHDVEEYDGVTRGSDIIPCCPTQYALELAAYDVECRGYHTYYSDGKSTKLEVLDNIHSSVFEIPDEAKDRCEQLAKYALEYIQNLDISESDTSGNYFHNLKAIASHEYVSEKHIGILVSLIPTYFRYLKDLEYKKAAEATRKSEESSEYAGNIGEKVTVDVTSVIKVSEWANQFGSTYLYKIFGADGNVYIWYSSRWFGDSPEWVSLKGTIKDHQEYKGVKQTILTRCKPVGAQK